MISAYIKGNHAQGYDYPCGRFKLYNEVGKVFDVGFCGGVI